MHDTKESFLNMHTPPARLTANEAAWYLGFKRHEIPMLVGLYHMVAFFGSSLGVEQEPGEAMLP